MKKIILSIIGLFFYFASNAQTPVQIISVPGVKYVYVGSLIMDENSGVNSQKIVVKILGGSFFSDSNGESTYYISNRSGLSIKQTSLGSYVPGRISLKAYKNGNNIDFYIMPDPNNYASFALTSFIFGNGISSQFVNITTQNTVPAGTDLAGALQIVPLMMTDQAGNIGLGTSTPHETLSVNGKIRAKEIKVEATNWPDYVFEEGYDVGKLEELESYIKVNKHLPDMPSAKEVESNGVDLGDLVKKLLKNQEELTLHILEQEKKISVLEKQLIKKQKTTIKTKQK